MKITKKIVSLVLTALMTTSVFSVVPTASAAKIDAKGRVYTYPLGETSKYGYRKSGFNVDPLTNSQKNKNLKKGTENLPSSYSLIDEGYMTEVKDQGDYGTCWAFAAAACAESNIIKNYGVYPRKINLSENHLPYYAYNIAYDKLNLLAGDSSKLLREYEAYYGVFQIGGNNLLSTSTLASGEGPVDELKYTEFGYGKTSDYFSIYDTTKAYRLNEYLLRDAYWVSMSDLDVMKMMIMTYGAGDFGYCHYTDEYYNEPYYNESKGAYCYIQNYTPEDYYFDYANHEVTVVGWDDNYSRNNFNSASRPKKDGAWLVKNSWSEAWGNDGYFWISYEDTATSYELCAFYDYAKSDEYKNIYQYDGTRNIATFQNSSSYDGTFKNGVYMSNVYTTVEDETISAVGFYTYENDVNYTIEIYKNVTSDPKSGVLVASSKGNETFSGYHTAKLPKKAAIEKGTKFSVVIKLESNTAGQGVSLPCDVSDNSSYINFVNSANAGQSYYSESGSSWRDVSSTDNINFRIKVLTEGTVIPETIPVTGVTLDKTEITKTVGEEEILTATVSPSDATDKSVVWYSSNSTIASVENGKVKAVAPGTATITVKTNDGAYTATCKVTVKAKSVSVTGVALDKTVLDLTVGNQEALEATVRPINATNKDVVWYSSNSSVATVNDGLVKAVAPGTATITVKTDDGGYTATCKVTVKEKIISVTGIELDRNELSLYVGDEDVLDVGVTPLNATDKSVVWTSSNPSVATVKDGVITAVAPGTAKITVKTNDGGYTAACDVTVINRVASLNGLELNYNSLDIEVGGIVNLSAQPLFDTSNGTAVSKEALNEAYKGISWYSSNSDVVKIVNDSTSENNYGVCTIKGVSAGKAVITAVTACGEYKSSCVVNVSSTGNIDKIYDPVNDSFFIGKDVNIKEAYELNGVQSVIGQIVYKHSNTSEGRLQNIIIEDVVDGEIVGIVIYDPSLYSQYNIGDVIRVKGEIKDYMSLTEIASVESVEVISSPANTIPAQEVTLSELLENAEDYINEYVLIKNVVLGEHKADGNTKVSSGDNSINIYKGAKYPENVKSGDTVDLYATLSVYKSTYQLRVGYTEDYIKVELDIDTDKGSDEDTDVNSDEESSDVDTDTDKNHGTIYTITKDVVNLRPTDDIIFAISGYFAQNEIDSYSLTTKKMDIYGKSVQTNDATLIWNIVKKDGKTYLKNKLDNKYYGYYGSSSLMDSSDTPKESLAIEFVKVSDGLFRIKALNSNHYLTAYKTIFGDIVFRWYTEYIAMASNSCVKIFKNTGDSSYNIADVYEKSKEDPIINAVDESIENIKYGDIDLDGSVAMLDVVMVQKHIAQLITLSEEQLRAADVAEDYDVVSMSDVVTIQKFIAELISVFPVEENKPVDTDINSDTESDKVATDTEETTDSENKDTELDTETESDSESLDKTSLVEKDPEIYLEVVKYMLSSYFETIEENWEKEYDNTKGYYTEDTYMTFVNVYTRVQEIFENPNATAEELMAAYNDLIDADYGIRTVYKESMGDRTEIIDYIYAYYDFYTTEEFDFEDEDIPENYLKILEDCEVIESIDNFEDLDDQALWELYCDCFYHDFFWIDDYNYYTFEEIVGFIDYTLEEFEAYSTDSKYSEYSNIIDHACEVMTNAMDNIDNYSKFDVVDLMEYIRMIASYMGVEE